MDFIQIAANFGVAVACLVGLSLAVWRGIIWVGTHVAQPVALRHIKFMDELAIATASQSQALQTMTIQQGKNLEGIERIMARLEEVIRSKNDLAASVNLLANSVHEMLREQQGKQHGHPSSSGVRHPPHAGGDLTRPDPMD